jgi:hypothetical protein
MSDHFDRLLARYTPLGAAEPAPARVRPRLPGPFERVEALRYGPPDPDEPAALIPSAPVAPAAPATTVRHEHEVRTDRHTVVRTERIRPDDSARAGRAAPEPQPRPATTERPHVRPAPQQPPARAGRRGRTADTADTPPPATAAAVRQPSAAGPLPAAATPVPRGSDTAAARGAARASVGRRAPKPAERVVHVQIGRLEVSAAPPPGQDRRPAARSGRAAPALTLDDYLSRASRGGKRD